MRRELLAPRPDWQRDMESIGFHYHSIDGTYWDESRCYVFTEAEIDALESASAELHEMALNAAQQVIGSQRYEEFAIPREW
ncbi:MAG TPA: glutathionylspermidine synthase family protein, partial [Burkholderiaceae bacterium]|nr:glutathionylspermidine synthase family protein [Burkholderiaceae bacterium]